MRPRSYIAIIVFGRGAVAHSGDFNIEEHGLSPVPPAVEASIRADKSRKIDGCHIVGKALDITGRHDDHEFVATTEDACGWGAAMGPVWIVRESAGKSKLILSSDGYSLAIGKKAQNGLRQLAISAGTAGWYEESLWKYDGVMYKQTAAYQFDG